MEARKELRIQLSAKPAVDLYPAAIKAVKNFEQNDAIYKELIHYKNSKTILGKHPIFKQRKLRGKIEVMSMGEAAVRKVNLENYIRRGKRNEAKFKKQKNDEKLSNITEKIASWSIELDLINAKLGL